MSYKISMKLDKFNYTKLYDSKVYESYITAFIECSILIELLDRNNMKGKFDIEKCKELLK